MRDWYVALVRKPLRRTRAQVMRTYRRNIYMQFKTGQISEYRVCRGGLEAFVLALIYNHEWAARIYRNGWWYNQ